MDRKHSICLAHLGEMVEPEAAGQLPVDDVVGVAPDGGREVRVDVGGQPVVPEVRVVELPWRKGKWPLGSATVKMVKGKQRH